MRWLLVLSLSLTACGTASNSKTAAVFAAAAAAATALDPDYATREEQDNKVESLDGKPVAKSVPSEALDHLDEIPLE